MNDTTNTQLIKEQWDAYQHEYMKVILKEQPDFYEFFANGGVSDEFEFQLLGDVRGLKLLDTCCACDARQAFSWTNLGAKVTACDISDAAIAIAKENAQKIGLDIDFQVADAQTLTPISSDRYDVVYATYYQFDATAPGRKYGVNVNKPTVNFFHTLADMINAISGAGFIIESMVETEEPNETMMSKLPISIAIIARK